MSRAHLALGLCAVATAGHAQDLPEFGPMEFCGRADLIEPAATEDCGCLERESRAVLVDRRGDLDPMRLQACLDAEARVGLRSYFKLLECVEPPVVPLRRCYAD